ncbi:MAG: cation transporter [SAR324 cluster bacterium]|nr:cation transporter [SAR324 cluster bacterium]
MTDCCSSKGCEIEKLRQSQGNILKTVLVINAAMFLVEIVSGWVANSTALLGDSLDMLGDTIVYAFSIYVLTRSAKWKAVASLFKGAVMAAFGFFVMGRVIYKVMYPEVPVFEAIGIVGLIALAANAVCLALLWRHRSDDINMNSVWLCSRNDIIANTSVLFAAFGVWQMGSAWPDILVGLGLALLFLHSSFHVLKDSLAALKESPLYDRRSSALS